MSSNLACDNFSQMSPVLQHECTRIPVTALASCGALLIAAEGPFLRFYNAKDSRYISSRRVFKAQAVHGISVYSEERDHVTKLVIWGGRFVRALEVGFAADGQDDDALKVYLSGIGKASDWILDLAPRPKTLEDESEYHKGICAAVTAHNALLEVSIECYSGIFTVAISELTSSSRSILYSAHLLWESSKRVLVAAGTAFGEIMYWSWTHALHDSPASRIHRVFLGHEGSVFGVRISQELPSECCQQLKRVIASCSDDRTIRIWDVSDVTSTAIPSADPENNLESPRVHHTGFSNEAFDAHSFTSDDCLATGWGHGSRVWTVRFLDSSLCEGSLFLQSAGEDATSRLWKLVPNENNDTELPYKLIHIEYAAHHNGKNIWASTISPNSVAPHSVQPQQIVCGAADSKITSHPFLQTLNNANSRKNTITDYTIHDVLSLVQSAIQVDKVSSQDIRKSPKKADFFRSYCFIDEVTILFTTNSGKVLVGSLHFESSYGQSSILNESKIVAQSEDLFGYSVCTNGPFNNVAFVAGANGSIYVYRRKANTLTKIHSVGTKVGDLHAATCTSSCDQELMVLLVTPVGQKEAQLLYLSNERDLDVCNVLAIPISDVLTGSLITSMKHVQTPHGNYLFLGFRRGSVAVYKLQADDLGTSRATLFRVIDKVHGEETVTHFAWNASSTGSSLGHLLSVGRDGRLSVHYIDLSTNTVELAHNLTLPIGPNIEGLYFHEDRLFVHGFSNKKWVLYDVTLEEEIMSVEIGGAHRSWAFQPRSSSCGGTLVWTRASGMHICSQTGSNHTVIRSGGHGREIKAVTVSPERYPTGSNRFIATGAEDTDIKLFQYSAGDINCRMTLRRHTTGIQQLQWSENGRYLFSSGGCEEFYVWRVRALPPFLGIGVVCEHVYIPESEHADLRIMSFDVTKRHDGAYIIAMVFSDSSLKVYSYTSDAAVKWQSLAKGIYFTSCLTQCIFLSTDKVLTAGTDGHAVVWHLLPGLKSPAAESSNLSTLSWQHPARIHQNSSKSMISCIMGTNTMLVVSGGDDGSLAFLLASTTASSSSSAPASSYACPPVLVNRAHGSAITSCAIITRESRTFILTSGNDEWVRLWEVVIQDVGSGAQEQKTTSMEDYLRVKRHTKVKTHVADVSSIAVLDHAGEEMNARVLLCGVGMEVIRIEWGAE